MTMAALLIGILGMLFILTAFILEEFIRRWNQNTVHYNLVNIVGSGMLLYYSVAIASIPFVILNAVWMVAACIKLGRLLTPRTADRKHRGRERKRRKAPLGI